jgi:hypothetical protein
VAIKEAWQVRVSSFHLLKEGGDIVEQGIVEGRVAARPAGFPMAAQIEAKQGIALLRQRCADVGVAPSVFADPVDEREGGFGLALRRLTTCIQVQSVRRFKVPFKRIHFICLRV